MLLKLAQLSQRLRPALLIAGVAVALCLAADAQACPTCKDGIAENDPQLQSMAAGYYYSILFMLSMPLVILGSFGSMAYLSVKRARREHAPAVGGTPATC